MSSGFDSLKSVVATGTSGGRGAGCGFFSSGPGMAEFSPSAMN